MKNKLSISKQEAKSLNNIISAFDKANTMVIGDLILDEFIWGDVSRISPEAPVPIVWVKSETFKLGGACNVASNISALKGASCIIGVVGDDDKGKALIESLKDKDINTDGIVVDSSRPTTMKTRVVARQRNQQVVRIDREVTQPLSDVILEQLIGKVKQNIKDVDAIILEDYGKGVITPALLEEVLSLASSNDKKVIVDPKKHHFDYYKGVTLITPNKSELEDATGIYIDDHKSLELAGARLLSDLGCEAVLVTLGESGMCLFEKDGSISDIGSVAKDVFDVSGAGDTVISAFAQSLISGANLKQAALISNFAAGIVVGKFGTEVASTDELTEHILTLC